MKKFAALLAIALCATPAWAENAGPWFGSESSAAEQISLNTSDVTSATDAIVSTADPVICPIEGCPLTKKLGKEGH